MAWRASPEFGGLRDIFIHHIRQPNEKNGGENTLTYLSPTKIFRKVKSGKNKKGIGTGESVWSKHLQSLSTATLGEEWGGEQAEVYAPKATIRDKRTVPFYSFSEAPFAAI